MATEESRGLDDTLQLLRVQAVAVWRYRWVRLIVAALVTLIGLPMVMIMPNKYESSTRVYVDTKTLLKPVLKGLAVESNMVVEIADLTKRTMLTSTNIKRVMREADLDISVSSPKEEEKLVNALRDSIIVESHGGDKRLRTPDTFYAIKYVHKHPETAYSVVKSVLDIFMESTLGETRKDSSLTEKFLQEQIEEYEGRLLKAEANLKEFKQKNINFMSGQSGGYFKQFSDAKDKLREAELELKESLEKSKGLQAEIEKVATGVSEYETAQLTTPYDDRISKLNVQLDELRLVYTDQHPNIVALKETISQLEKEKAESVKNLDKLASEGELTNNKLYQELTFTLGKANAEVSALSVRVENYKAEVDRLKAAIDTIPDIEAKLAQLDRDYAVNKEKYNSLVSRREAASLSKQAEAGADKVMFKIIEAPKIPVVPKSPNRPMLLAAVYVLSLVVGVAIAWLLAQLKPTIMDSRSINEKFGYPVIGVVSVVMSDKQKSYERRKLMGFVVIAILHFSVSAGLIASQVMYDDPLAIVRVALKGII